MQDDIVPRLVAVLQKALLENVEELTRKRFTGILSVKLDCAFNQGGLRNIMQEVSQRINAQQVMSSTTITTPKGKGK